MKNLDFNLAGNIRRLKKNSVIKNVKYLTQVICGEEITIQLDPPRNLKITNKLKKDQE